MKEKKVSSSRHTRADASESAECQVEEAVLAVLEQQRRRNRPPPSPSSSRGAESQRDVLPAVPPDASDLFNGGRRGSPDRESGGHARAPSPWHSDRPRPTLSSAAYRVMNIGRTKRLLGAVGDQGSKPYGPEKAADEFPFRDVTVAVAVGAGARHNRGVSCADRLFDDLQMVDAIFRQSERSAIPETAKEIEETDEGVEASFVEKDAFVAGFSDRSKEADEETGRRDESSPLMPKTDLRGLRGRIVKSTAIRTPFWEVMGPRVLLKNTFFFLRTTFLFAMVPLFVAAYLLFTFVYNPELEFLPLEASLSWWLIFVVRQLVTLQLAICTEYVFVDSLALRSPMATKILGPLLTLFMIQAKGWPFIISAWGTWDLLLLHGTKPFTKNWLFFLRIEMLSDANPNGGIIGSDFYLRILLSLVVTGVLVSVKRTYLALYLGRRTFVHYKPRLEQIMVNMLLLSEVADLAAQTEMREFAESMAHEDDKEHTRPKMPPKLLVSRKWGQIKFKDDQSESSDKSGDDDGDGTPATLQPGISDDTDVQKSPSASSKEHRNLSVSSVHDLDEAAFRAHYLQRRETSSIKIKDLLDRWEEPENKLEKAAPVSIHDILQFRKALSYMDDTHPFSVSFGPSDTRDRCVKSSQRVYKRLLKFVPESDILPFDVIGALAYEEDGSLIHEKNQALVRLFRPDRHNQITDLVFVQTCDWVYKKLRFFRASVANSSLIDQVLERVFNFFFYAILILVIISGVMDLDPWSLLVSVSTLLVSFAFAVGPSAAKVIEGLLLIAVRRPYDLGDRISLSTADFVGTPDASLTWFVEDVNLFTTTLRFAGTNEVSTVNNGAIANSRIVNFARSPKALVSLVLLFDIKATHEQMEQFKKAVENYIKDNPRTWASIVQFKTTSIDPDMCVVGYSLTVQHMKSWHEFPFIQENKGQLMQFCIQVMERLGIVYDSPGSTVNVRMKKDSTSNDPSSDEQDKRAAAVEQE